MSSRAWRELAAAVGSLRAQLPLLAPPGAPDPTSPAPDTGVAPTRMAAGSLQAFYAARRGLPPWQRRVRRLADDYQHALVLAALCRIEEFTRAETLGAEMLARLPEQGCPRRPWREFRAAFDTAARACTATGPTASRPDRSRDACPRTPADRAPRRGRSPLVDQDELRWRIRAEITLIRSEYLYGTAAPRWRPAATELLPWLEHAHTWLVTPRQLAELERLAEQWRARRAEVLPSGHDYDDWADVILVEPVPRQPDSWWWRLRHGHQPPPPES
ncbi:MAG: hypothetical protein M3235_21720 [Actinomycetota bacterium]|nr:hypothetical protein [Actinomycetota bacterium]